MSLNIKMFQELHTAYSAFFLLNNYKLLKTGATALVIVAITSLGAYCALAQTVNSETNYKETQWEELIPESWNPEVIFEGININDYEDNDQRLAEVIKKFNEAWQNAPANADMDGARIKIPGFVVPLDWDEQGGLKEFLLVPYFGACIHVPPPPANQIIYISMENAVSGVSTMDTIWVYGELRLERTDSADMGASSYSMTADKVERY